MDKYFATDHFPESNTGDTFEVLYPSGTLSYRGDEFSDYPGSRLRTNSKRSDGQLFVDFVTLLETATNMESYANNTDIDEVLGYIVASSML